MKLPLFVIHCFFISDTRRRRESDMPPQSPFSTSSMSSSFPPAQDPAPYPGIISEDCQRQNIPLVARIQPMSPQQAGVGGSVIGPAGGVMGPAGGMMDLSMASSSMQSPTHQVQPFSPQVNNTNVNKAEANTADLLHQKQLQS